MKKLSDAIGLDLSAGDWRLLEDTIVLVRSNEFEASGGDVYGAIVSVVIRLLTHPAAGTREAIEEAMARIAPNGRYEVAVAPVDGTPVRCFCSSDGVRRLQSYFVARPPDGTLQVIVAAAIADNGEARADLDAVARDVFGRFRWS